MANIDSITLDPEAGILDPRRSFSDRAIWTFGFLGMAVLVAAMTALWDKGGYLVDEGAGGRWIVLLVALVYGLILGWMMFPRIGTRLT